MWSLYKPLLNTCVLYIDRPVMRKRRGRSRRNFGKDVETFRNLSNLIIWLMFSLFTYLGYFVEVRTYLLSNFGYYALGFIDALILILSLLAMFLYAMSCSTHAHN